MSRELVHIYGPLSINSYGFMIAIGLIVFLWLANKHPLRKQTMSADAFTDVVLIGVLTATVAGRLLYIATEWHTIKHWTEIFNVWEGGFSLLGSTIGIMLFMPLYLAYRQLPILLCLDIIGLHAPLLIGISRIGCFLAGCCYGASTTVPWATMYTNSDSLAPLHIPIHPSQLYSTGILIGAFFFLRYIYQRVSLLPGQAFMLCLMCIGIERFFIDFFRGDQEFFTQPALAVLSIHQWLALGIIATACVAYSILMRPYAYHVSS